jgi:hypothetical protein
MKNSTSEIKKACFVFSFLAFTTVSFSQNYPDSTIKINTQRIQNPLESINRLEPKTFEYDTQNFKQLRLDKGEQFGFMAENMQEVFPSLVGEKSISYLFSKNTYRTATIKTIDESALIPVLVAALKEQQTEIEKLKSEMVALRNKLGTAAQ